MQTNVEQKKAKKTVSSPRGLCYQIIKNLRMEEAKKKVWYHVIIYPACFGFCAVNGIVMDAPFDKRDWIGKTLQEIKPYLITAKAKAYEIL